MFAEQNYFISRVRYCRTEDELIIKLYKYVLSKLRKKK